MASDTSVDTSAKLAVLIDADKPSPAAIDGLLAEVAKYGTAHVKRADGAWTVTSLRGWKEQLLDQAIHTIQQFAYTPGKNATDAAMVIDAMDLLYSGRFDGFCLVSSDSDFTRLASRLRESGLTVYGFGERKTPKPFVAACDKFIYTENLAFDVPDEDADDADESTDEAQGGGEASGAHVASDSAAARAGTAGGKRTSRASAAQLKSDTKLVTLLRNAAEAGADHDGWTMLSAVGEIITKQRPDFDS